MGLVPRPLNLAKNNLEILVMHNTSIRPNFISILPSISKKQSKV